MVHKQRTFVESLNDAVQGILYVIRTERNMRIHFLSGFAVLLTGILVGTSRTEWILLCLTVCLVWVAEMVNTVVEEIVDLVEPAIHPDVRIIKDISAGFVLLATAMAIVVGLVVFSRYWNWPLQVVAFRIRHASWHVVFLALLVVVFSVVAAKVFLHRGTPFRGGIVSGHSAVAFSLWTAVLFTQTSLFAIAVTFLLAVLVAQSRLREKIHNGPEVVAGALTGFLLTTLLFRIFG